MEKTAASVLGPAEGEEFTVGPLAIRSRVSGAQTGGAFEMYFLSMGVATVDYHVHHRMDETIYVLDGEVEFNVQGTTFLRPAGSVAFVPRGLHHGFSNRGPATASVILVFAPSTNQHEYFRAMQSLLTGSYASKIEALQKQYDQELVPPGT